MFKLSQLLLWSSAIALGACGGGGGGSSSTPTPPAAVAPTAEFTASVEMGTVPLSVTFSSTSTAGSASISEYLWDFGDGTTSTESNPSHTYTAAGDFDVTLTVTTSVGSDDESKVDFVDVDPAIAAIEPTEIAVFDVGGIEIEAARNQLLLFLQEDVTTAQREAVFAEVNALGAGVQSYNQPLRMVQIITDDGAELTVLDALDDLDGVSSGGLNETLDLEVIQFTDNASGFANWLKKTPRSERKAGPRPQEAVTIDSSFTGGYWVDEIGLERALSALEELTLDDNTIAVVDTGLPASQDIMAEGRVRRIEGDGDALTDDNTFGTGENRRIHGRNVIGFAAANLEAVRGVDSESDVISVDIYERFEILGTPVPFLKPFRSEFVEGIVTAIDEGATVVNLSQGSGDIICSTPKAQRLSRRQDFRDSLSGAVNYARRNNVNVVFSAGNYCEKEDNQRLNNSLSLDNDSWDSNALVVAASDVAQNDACFSTMGSVIDIAAPGESVSYGDGRLDSGTSLAAPMVTGALGLLRSINNTLSAPEVKSILLRTANETMTARTVEEHTADPICAEDRPRTPFPADAGVATDLPGILNIGSAVQSALLANDVDLTTLTRSTVALGENVTVPVSVTLPEEGVTALDLVFLIDRSGSYSDDINTLQSQAGSIISALEARDIDIQYGVSSFSDFPISPFGRSTDEEFTVLQTLTSDVDLTLDAIDRLDQPLQSGSDSPESQYEALFQVANNALNFRDGALPVVLFATDADFHDSDVEPSYPGAGRLETLAALRDNNIIVFGLQSGSSSAAATRLEELATETEGAVFELDRSSSDIANAISDAVGAAVSQADITLEPLAGNAWVNSIAPAVFEDVAAGETVTFDVTLNGIRNGSAEDDLDYEVYLWARAGEEALISRFLQPIDTE